MAEPCIDAGASFSEIFKWKLMETVKDHKGAIRMCFVLQKINLGSATNYKNQNSLVLSFFLTAASTRFLLRRVANTPFVYNQKLTISRIGDSTAPVQTVQNSCVISTTNGLTHYYQNTISANKERGKTVRCSCASIANTVEKTVNGTSPPANDYWARAEDAEY